MIVRAYAYKFTTLLISAMLTLSTFAANSLPVCAEDKQPWQLMMDRGKSAIERGEMKKAEGLFEQALTENQYEELPAAESATLANDLAVIYMQESDYARAKPLLELALNKRVQALGPEHQLVAQTFNNLASLDVALHDNIKAEDYSLKAVCIWEWEHWPQTREASVAANNYMRLLNSLGRQKEAQVLYKHIKQIRTAAISEKNLSEGITTDGTPWNICMLESQKAMSNGDLKEAERLNKKAIAEARFIVSPGDRNSNYGLVQSMHALAAFYQSQGRLAEAERLYTEVIASREKSKDVSESMISDLDNLAQLYIARKDSAHAEASLRKLLPLLQGSGSGEGGLKENPKRENSAKNNARQGCDTRDYDRICSTLISLAELTDGPATKQICNRYLIQAEKLQPLLSEHHRIVMIDKVAGIAIALGDLNRAEALCQQALSLELQASGEKSVQYAYILFTLARLHEQTGKQTSALHEYREALSLIWKEPAAFTDSTIPLLQNAARQLMSAGHLVESAQVLQKLVVSQSESNTVPWQEQVDTYSLLAELFERRGNYERQAECLENDLALMRANAHDSDNEKTIDTTRKLANVYLRTGRFSDSETLLNIVLQSPAGRNGGYSPLPSLILRDLAHCQTRQGKLLQAEKNYRLAITTLQKYISAQQQFDSAPAESIYHSYADMLRLAERPGKAFLIDLEAKKVHQLSNDGVPPYEVRLDL